MSIALIIYTIILILAYNYSPKSKIYNTDIETLFIYLLIGGWIVIFAYNVYKLKESKQAPLIMADILPLIYQAIGLIIAIGVLISIADNLLGGKIIP
jgi:hypothetical protein